jgi:hypothetical protein
MVLAQVTRMQTQAAGHCCCDVIHVSSYIVSQMYIASKHVTKVVDDDLSKL